MDVVVSDGQSRDTGANPAFYTYTCPPLAGKNVIWLMILAGALWSDIAWASLILLVCRQSPARLELDSDVYLSSFHRRSDLDGLLSDHPRRSDVRRNGKQQCLRLDGHRNSGRSSLPVTLTLSNTMNEVNEHGRNMAHSRFCIPL